MFALGASVLLTTGCEQWARHQVGNAQERIRESEELRAKEYHPNDWEAAQTTVNTAESQLNNQDKTGRETAKEANRLSKELLERTKTAHANWLREQAFDSIKIAQKNNGQGENPEKYAQIISANEKGGEQLAKEKWDAAIETFDKQVIKEVEFLLSNLKNQAVQGLAEARQIEEELKAEGAPDNAPEYMTRIAAQIAEIDKFINVEKDYRSALNTRDQARQTKQEGIQQTKLVKSEKEIRDIENLLDEATSLQAEIYALQSYNAVSKEFENVIAQFLGKNYDTVLASTPKLKPQVEDLILETKRESARSSLKEVNDSIQSLTDKKARTYLPGRVEQLDALSKESDTQFVAEQYVESKATSLRGLELKDQIVEEFDTLTATRISEAQEQLAAAQGVFETMSKIFDQKIEGAWDDASRTLEGSKHALKEELRAKLNNSMLSLGVANEKREQTNFDVAIETALSVNQASVYVQEQTYRVVAHNAILEIARTVTTNEREGGRKYAPAELNKTQELLEESKGLLASSQYRDAVRRAADTKAQLEIMLQELGRVAVLRIDAAADAIDAAGKNKADQYSGSTLADAVSALDRAKTALEANSPQQAIEQSLQAEVAATNAMTEALRLYAQEQLAKADAILVQARAAGAQRYAPEALMKATDTRDNLQQLYNQGSYREAVDVSQDSVDLAHEALYAKVIEAENAIAAAKRFEGWEFEPDRLSGAIIAAETAREQLDRGVYQDSELHAQQAISTANNVSRDAKRASFSTRMTNLEQKIAAAQQKGTGYYQVNDVAKLLGEMNALRNEFTPDNYEDYAERVALLDAQLAGLVQMTPDVLKDLVLSMQDRLTALEARGARNFKAEQVEEIERRVKYAQLDYRAEKFRPSYENIKDAQILLDQVELYLGERDYDSKINAQFALFSEQMRKFGEVLDMGTPILSRLIVGSQGRAQAVSILQTHSPSDLRAEITQIQANIRALPVPWTRVNTQEAALKMMEVAKTSATNFEKLLILDQYDKGEAREIVETAFLQMHQAKRLQNDIQRSLEYPQTQFKPIGVELVVSQGS